MDHEPEPVTPIPATPTPILPSSSDQVTGDRSAGFALVLPSNGQSAGARPSESADLPTAEVAQRRVELAERLRLPLQLNLPEGTHELAAETWLPHAVPGPGPDSPVHLDRAAFRPVIADLANTWRLDPVDARLDVRDDRLAILTPAAPGREVRIEALIDAIERQLPRADRTVDVPLQTVQAPVRVDTLHQLGIRRVLGEGFTPYDRAGGDRSFNIELAAARLNGLVVPPGATFSFNRAIGPTSIEGGYRWGWGIVTTGGSHRMVPSEAGGICQVATTLFQAAFWSGIEVVERHPHTFWIENYGMKPFGLRGLDATVDDGSGFDFRFRNNTDGHILIRALVRDAGLHVQLVGDTPGWRVIAGEPAISQVVEADYAIVRQPTEQLPAGQERWLELAGPGFRSVLHRTITDATGQVILSDSFDSSYAPSRNVLGVGRG